MDRIGRALGTRGTAAESAGVAGIPPRLWIAAGAGAVVVVAVAVGLVWGRGAPAVEADEADTYAAAPGCGSIPEDQVRDLVPGAELEKSAQGPMANADSSTCVWTSVGSGEGPPRSLHLDFTAHFTDKAGDISGTRAAARRLDELAPIGDLEGADPVPELGEGALAWPGTADRNAAEVVFRRDNMLVEVFYGGDPAGGSGGLDYGDARDGAVAIAEQVAGSM